MDERQAINPKAIEDLVQRMLADGRPIEEQCTVEILPPYIVENGEIQATVFRRTPRTIETDHKDTTEPHE